MKIKPCDTCLHPFTDHWLDEGGDYRWHCKVCRSYDMHHCFSDEKGYPHKPDEHPDILSDEVIKAYEKLGGVKIA
jgi:hypothetical protein